MSLPVGDPTNYIRRIHGPREPLLDAVLRRSLLGRGLRPIQVDDHAARLLELLTHVHRPARVLEIGTFVGYSAIHIGRGLPSSARLITLERDAEMVAVARANIEEAELSAQVDVLHVDAYDYLRAAEPNSFDMIFIDGDKVSYPDYLKMSFPLLVPGGLLVADDALAQGDFSDESDGDGAVGAIDTYNRAVMRSNSLFSTILATRNGLMVSYKRDATGSG